MSTQANYDGNRLKNRFSAQARLLNEAVLNFLLNQEEVTMMVGPARFAMKNFVEDVGRGRNLGKDSGKAVVRTELTMQPGEFEHFAVNQDDVRVTFCLKELRSFISFADALTLPLSASFDDGGE